MRIPPSRRLVTRAVALATTALITICLTACRQGESGFSSTLRIGVANDVGDWDPHTSTTLGDQQILDNIFRGLTTLDPDTLEPIGEIAESWVTSDDGLSWTFTLRDSAKFSNDKPVTADDVVYSIKRIMDPDTAASAASEFEAVADVVAVDESTVRFELSRPYPLLLNALQLPAWSAIIPKDSADTIASTHIGYGPYKFAESQPDQEIVLVKNDNYAGDVKPSVEKVVFAVVPDSTSRLAALRSGQLDLLPTVDLLHVGEIEGDHSVQMFQYPSSYVAELGFNNAAGPFADVRVRRAVALALDKEGIAQVATLGLGGVADTMVSPASPIDVNVDPVQRDVDAAKQLLAEAGYADGFSFTFSPCGGTAFPDMARAGEVIAANLADVGITATLQNKEAGVWADEVITQGRYDAFICALVSGNDPDGHTFRYFTSDGAYNFSRYRGSPELDALLKQGREVTDSGERSEIYSRAWTIINEDVPWVPLYWLPNVTAAAANLSGFRGFPEGNLRLEYLTIDQSAP